MQTYQPPQAVVFDMDGLMLDTEPIYQRTWEQACGELGRTIDAGLRAKLIGRNNRDCERALVEAFGPGFPLQVFRARWQALWRAEVARSGVACKPGLGALLDRLDRLALPRAVATSTDREFAELSLRSAGVAERCGALIPGDEVSRGKPAPDIYLCAAERLGVVPERCLALEDSLPGVTAAARAGMRTVLVPEGDPPPARELPPGTIVHRSLHAVAPLLGPSGDLGDARGSST